jgi:hypothetical protein
MTIVQRPGPVCAAQPSHTSHPAGTDGESGVFAIDRVPEFVRTGPRISKGASRPETAALADRLPPTDQQILERSPGAVPLDLVGSRTDSKGVTIQVYRPAGRPQYATG